MPTLRGCSVWVRLALLALAIIQTCRGQIINIPSNTIMGIEGANINFTCDSNNGLRPLVQINGNVNDPRSARISEIGTSSNGAVVTYSYQFISLTRADNGTTIQCFMNAVPSLPIIIIVDFPPLYIPTTQQFTVIEGVNAEISFQLDALPRVTSFSWTRNGAPLTSSSRIQLTANRIRFPSSIRREDSGNYTVTSVDLLGNGSASLSIDVYYLPTFTVGSTSSRLTPIIIGSNATLSCSVTANPSITNLTLSTAVESNVEITADSYVITLAGLGGAQNGGNYTCRAINPVGVSELTYNVILGNLPDITTMIFIERTGDVIVINITYNDNSDPPITHFLVHVGASLTYQRGPNEFPLMINSTLFTTGQAVPVIVEAVNLFGSVNFTDSFNIPQPTPSSGGQATPTPTAAAGTLTFSAFSILLLLITAMFA